MGIVVCDLCKKNPPTNRIKYKAEKYDGYEFLSGGAVRTWRRIELCDECLYKIIAKTTSKSCISCEYLDKKGNEEPCKYCKKYSLWRLK